jgi:hypothetical protein
MIPGPENRPARAVRHVPRRVRAAHRAYPGPRAYARVRVYAVVRAVQPRTCVRVRNTRRVRACVYARVSKCSRTMYQAFTR